MLLVGMGAFAVDAAAYGQLFLSRVTCAEASSPENCARRVNVSVAILTGLEISPGAKIKTYFLAEFGQQRWVLSGEISTPSWVEYRGGSIPHYSTEVASEEPIWVNFGEMNLSDFFGLRLAVGYGAEPEGSRYPCGSALDCMIYHNSWGWVWELTSLVSSSKKLVVDIVRDSGVEGGSVEVHTTPFTSSATTLVPMAQTWEVRVTPPSASAGHRIKTTIKINTLVAHAQCRPSAEWYGEVAHSCYFSSYRHEPDRLEVKFQLEQIPPEPSSEDSGGDAPPPPAVINGCTDVTATNYDPTATVNDGSCTYPPPPPPGGPG